MSIADNGDNSLYSKDVPDNGMAAGPDGMYSFQPGNALDNANQDYDTSLKQAPSITAKDSSLYSKPGMP